MRRMRGLFFRLRNGERGQAAVILALGMTAFVGLAGISVEAGHAYYAYQQLVASTNAATLAGAQAMPDTAQATANVNLYSSATVNKVVGMNASSLLTNVGLNISYVCSSTVEGMDVACETSTGGNGGANAVKVTQTAQVPSWFAGMFGIHTFNFSYTAMAAMRGGMASQWNIAIILDTTGSMSQSDNGKQCSGTKISCALKGTQALLADLYPCALGQSCTGSGASYTDDVALYVFPGVSTATASYDYCTGSGYGTGRGETTRPTISDYIVSSYPSGYTYQVIPYSNNYRTSDAATTLNTSSDIVAATGYSGTSCTGIQAPGGAGTYYAQVIKQAQSDLVAQQANNKGSRNALIILSDGDASASVSGSSNCGSATPYVYGTSTHDGQQVTEYICSNSDLQPSSAGSLNGYPANNPDSYTYPSAQGECGQAVQAAQAAASAGTTVFTIGYGSETSGCSTDRPYSPTVTTPNGTWQPGGSPCQALGDMASAAANFFSDDGDGCKATVPSNQAMTTLTAIFRQIANSLTTPRLVPGNSL